MISVCHQSRIWTYPHEYGIECYRHELTQFFTAFISFCWHRAVETNVIFLFLIFDAPLVESIPFCRSFIYKIRASGSIAFLKNPKERVGWIRLLEFDEERTPSTSHFICEPLVDFQFISNLPRFERAPLVENFVYQVFLFKYVPKISPIKLNYRILHNTMI